MNVVVEWMNERMAFLGHQWFTILSNWKQKRKKKKRKRKWGKSSLYKFTETIVGRHGEDSEKVNPESQTETETDHSPQSCSQGRVRSSNERAPWRTPSELSILGTMWGSQKCLWKECASQLNLPSWPASMVRVKIKMISARWRWARSGEMKRSEETWGTETALDQENT